MGLGKVHNALYRVEAWPIVLACPLRYLARIHAINFSDYVARGAPDARALHLRQAQFTAFDHADQFSTVAAALTIGGLPIRKAQGYHRQMSLDPITHHQAPGVSPPPYVVSPAHRAR